MAVSGWVGSLGLALAVWLSGGVWWGLVVVALVVWSGWTLAGYKRNFMKFIKRG